MCEADDKTKSHGFLIDNEGKALLTQLELIEIGSSFHEDPTKHRLGLAPFASMPLE